MHSVIYSADNKFQVIGFVKGKSDKGWIKANEMSGDGTMKRNKIDHFEVKGFTHEPFHSHGLIEGIDPAETRDILPVIKIRKGISEFIEKDKKQQYYENYFY